MFRNKFFSVALLFAFSSTLIAQNALFDKPVDKWSKNDAMDILSSSSWAQTHFSNAGAAAAAQSEALRQQSDNRLTGQERGRAERVGTPSPVIIRLHSALPIRLALLRLNQLAAGYDKMNDKQKGEFNDSGRRLLECSPCQKYYVVSLTLAPNPSGQNVEEAIFEGMTMEQMKGNIWLENEKDQTRQLVHFIAPQKRGDSAVFFFDRNDEKGEALVSKDNKELSFVFNPTFMNNTNRFAHLLPRKFDFKVSKITVKDQVVF
jgi:hypothetical protein